MLKTLLEGKGNYRKFEDDLNIEYRYFGNLICVVNKPNKTYTLDACGWNGHSSTTRALNDLDRYYKAQGYRCIARR